MRIFRCNLCIFKCNFAKFSRGHAHGPSRVVGLRLICDVTRLWRNLAPLGNFLRTPLNVLLQSWASEGFLPRGALGDFSKIFPEGSAKVMKFVFSHSKLKKELFLLKISKGGGGQGLLCPLPTPVPTISERYHQWSMLIALWKTSWATKRSSKC